MKKISKVFVMLLTVMAIFLSVLPLTVNAEGATISLSKSSVSVGDSVTATIRVSQANLLAVDMTVNYNEEVLTFDTPNSGNISGGAGVIKIVWDTATEVNTTTFTLTFKAAKAGSCVINIPEVGASIGGGLSQLVNLTGAAATVTVKDATKSENADLKQLILNAGKLSPSFSPSVTSYRVVLNNEETECKVYATPSDEGATVSVEGSPNMKVGDNVRVITVTAPSGNKKSYTLLITRLEKSDQTTSDVTSSDAANENNPLDTVIDGVSYRVLADLNDIELPTGFSVTKTMYNENEVSVATDSDGNFELFYLTNADSKEVFPYIYNKETGTFKKIKIIKQNNKHYIVVDLPSGSTIDPDFQVTSQTIDGTELTCYESKDEKLEGIFYIYCFFNGKYSMYRYDTVENVIQRAPELSIDNFALQSGATLEGNSFLDRFKILSSNAKTIVVCIAIALVALIALIVLLIVKAIRSRKFVDFDYDDEDFEDIQVYDDFKISDDDE